MVFEVDFQLRIINREKTLESPLDCKETQPVHPKGYQSWVFTDAEAETPILWPPHAKSWLFGKDLDAGRDWGQEEKGMTEDEMAGWHHWLDGREAEWTPGVGGGQGGLAAAVLGVAESRTRIGLGKDIFDMPPKPWSKKQNNQWIYHI